MFMIYPAQSWLFKKLDPGLQTEFLDRARMEIGKHPEFIVRHVVLEKDGIRSSGLLIAKPETIQNGKWVLQATGNSAPVEGAISSNVPNKSAIKKAVETAVDRALNETALPLITERVTWMGGLFRAALIASGPYPSVEAFESVRTAFNDVVDETIDEAFGEKLQATTNEDLKKMVREAIKPILNTIVETGFEVRLKPFIEAPAQAGINRANKYQEAGFNLLLVNNPGVGRSEGTSTPETIGECQSTAIKFLETALKANKIVLAGYSIGGGSIGQAILQHDFAKSDADFFVARQVTFGRVSELAEAHAPSFIRCCAPALVRWSGCEIDNVESSKKLAKLDIPEVVIQGEADEVIPYDYSLMHALKKERIEGNHHLLPGVNHNNNEQVLSATVEQILAWVADPALEAVD